MKQLTDKAKRTLHFLRVKSEGTFFDRKRMPSIHDIHALLTELKIHHTFEPSQNLVERSTPGKMYVNERYLGKKGFKLVVNQDKKNDPTIRMDTSSSFYSERAKYNAEELLKIIDKKIGVHDNNRAVNN